MKVKYNNFPLPVGTRLGNNKYTIYKKISSGGFGMVYLAKDEYGDFFAIKEFLPSSFNCRTTNPDETKLRFESSEKEKEFKVVLTNFYQETETVAQINHPNVIKIIDIFEENNTCYFVMPLEKGLSLFHYVLMHKFETGDKLSDEEIRDFFVQICEGVQYLHDNKLLHLDIKPANIWIRPDNTIAILDLGSAREVDNYRKSKPPAFTHGYAAPELYQDLKTTHLTFSTDVYSIGGALKFCLDAIPPKKFIKFDQNLGYGIAQIFKEISIWWNNKGREFCLNKADKQKNKYIKKFFIKLSKLFKGENLVGLDIKEYASSKMGSSSLSLLKIVEKCMNKNPALRYQTVNELKQDLATLRFLPEEIEHKSYINYFVSNQRKNSFNE